MIKVAILKAAALVVALTTSFATSPTQAIGTQCIRDSWAYADAMSGTTDHNDPTWRYYAAEYQDEHSCAVSPCNPDKPGCPPCDPVYGCP